MKSLQQLERIKLSNLLTDKVKKLDDNDAMVDETIETIEKHKQLKHKKLLCQSLA